MSVRRKNPKVFREIGHRAERRRIVVRAVVGAIVCTMLVSATAMGRPRAVTSVTPPPAVLFHLDLRPLPRVVKDATTITPSVGSPLKAVVRGKGSIISRGAGRAFLIGGQQTSDTAFLTATGGESTSSWFAATEGALTVRAVSSVNVDQRSSPTGRNINTFVDLTTGTDDSPASTALNVSLVANPDESPYFSVSVNGGSAAVAITPNIAGLLQSGQSYVLTLSWRRGSATFALNGQALTTFDIPPTPLPITSGRRLTIGAAANYGGGYFSLHEDSLVSVTLTGSPVVSPTTTTPGSTTTTVTTTRVSTTVAPTTVAPTTVGPTTAFPTTVPLGLYPPQWDWDPATGGDTQPQPATSADGAPLIKQIRNGQVIATYTRLGGGSCAVRGTPECGAFSRGNTFLNKRDGDIFEVYPAVYQGDDQQPYFGPMFESDAAYTRGEFITPNSITVRGVTVNGKRPVIRVGSSGASYNTLNQAPVYFDKGANLTMENIDIDAAGGSVGKAGVYIVGTTNLTLRNMRIHGFRSARANGVFGGANASGTLLIDRVQLFDNGGDGGPEHNVYINKSSVDPNWTVRMINSLSTDVYYGHLFKSRAQVNILEGNYFKGTLPHAGEPQAEAFNVEIPNGGRLTMRNNILVKNKSGDSSNGILVFYGAEGLDGRPNAVLIEHNTFVTFTKDFDNQGHRVFPMGFLYPLIIPGTPQFPFADVRVSNNVFVGFDTAGYGPAAEYRGANPLIVGFSDIRQDFSLKNPISATNSTIVGSPAYAHVARGGTVRQKATFGAVD